MTTSCIRWGLCCLVLSACVKTGAAQDEDQPLYKTKYRVINVHRHCDIPREESIKAEYEVMQRVGFSAMVNLLIDGGSTAEGSGKVLSWQRRATNPGVAAEAGGTQVLSRNSVGGRPSS